MPRPHPLALLVFGLSSASLSALGCREEPPVERHYPMRAPPTTASAPVQATPAASGPAQPDSDEQDEPPKLGERPRAEPAIEEALRLISASGLRFVDQADDEDSRPSEYTAQQFAAMLRSKWDWLGYDITALDVWLEQIATRSFKTNLPYQVVLGDGTSADLRPWLEAQLDAKEAR